MKIDIIGKGNVATHLMKALSDSMSHDIKPHDMVDVMMVGSRDLHGLRPDSDLYILAVSDNAISEMAHMLRGKLPAEGVLAHTSGTTPLSVLDNAGCHTGVFYPLQTFSKDATPDYSNIPFLIEGQDAKSMEMLMKVASMISHKVYQMDSTSRRELHLASVVACNFANHLWALSADYLEEHGLDFKLLLPLLEETVRKLQKMNPAEAQTGPAVRHDTVTIDSHLKMLAENGRLSEIYRLMSKSIMDTSQQPK